MVDVEGDVDKTMPHQTDTACSWLVCHSRGDCRREHCANCIHLPRLSGDPAAQFLGKPAVRPHSMAGGAPTPCGRLSPLVVSRESGAPADQVEETPGRASLEKLGCRTHPQLHAGGVGQQQHKTMPEKKEIEKAINKFYANQYITLRTLTRNKYTLIPH